MRYYPVALILPCGLRSATLARMGPFWVSDKMVFDMPELPALEDEELQDYIDGRLDAVQTTAFENRLASDPEMAAKAAAYRAQINAMQQLYDPILAEPVPERFQVIMRDARRQRWQPTIWRIAASIAFLAVGAAGGWYGNDYYLASKSLLDPFIQQATLSHKLAIVERADGLDLDETDQNRISPNYIPANFGAPVRIPTLKNSNLKPVSLVSATDSNGNRMTVTYADREKRRRTLFIRKISSGDDLPVKYKDDGEIPVLYWIDGPLIYVLVGEGSKDELVTIAEEIYRSSAAPLLPRGVTPSQ